MPDETPIVAPQPDTGGTPAPEPSAPAGSAALGGTAPGGTPSSPSGIEAVLAKLSPEERDALTAHYSKRDYDPILKLLEAPEVQAPEVQAPPAATPPANAPAASAPAVDPLDTELMEKYADLLTPEVIDRFHAALTDNMTDEQVDMVAGRLRFDLERENRRANLPKAATVAVATSGGSPPAAPRTGIPRYSRADVMAAAQETYQQLSR